MNTHKLADILESTGDELQVLASDKLRRLAYTIDDAEECIARLMLEVNRLTIRLEEKEMSGLNKRMAEEMADLYQKKLQRDYDSLVAENLRKDKQIADMEYRVKTLEYHVRRLSDQLRLKTEIDNTDDGRC